MSIHSKSMKEAMQVTYQIKKAAVLGSGVMGSGIAAHLANIGIPTLLLDMVPRDLSDADKGNAKARNQIAQGSIEKLLKQKPAPLASKKNLALLTAGNFEDDLDKLKDVDWII